MLASRVQEALESLAWPDVSEWMPDHVTGLVHFLFFSFVYLSIFPPFLSCMLYRAVYSVSAGVGLVSSTPSLSSLWCTGHNPNDPIVPDNPDNPDKPIAVGLMEHWL